MSDSIIYNGATCYVIRTRDGYEVRVHARTHSVCVGTQSTADKAIRTAQRLERHPDNARRFAGV